MMSENSISAEGLGRRFVTEAGWRLRATPVALLNGVRSHGLLYIVACVTYIMAGVVSLWLGLPVQLGLVSLITGSTIVFLVLIIGIWLAAELARLWVHRLSRQPRQGP